MATSMKKTTNTSIKSEKKAEVINETSEDIKSVNDKTIQNEETTQERRVFNKEDLIPCRSITFGELLMVGAKTKFVYKWADYDDVQEVEYQDLAYDVKIPGGSYSRFPRFVVLDDDFIEQNPVLNDVYSKTYSKSDIRKILDLSPNEIKKIVPELPKGVRDSLKTMVATMITNGSFDSMNKIKILDEIFDTQMALTLFNA